jgi:hypothetical protein
MLSTMPDYPLALVPIMEHGGKVHGESEVATRTGDGVRRASFREVAARARKLAAALRRRAARGGAAGAGFAGVAGSPLQPAIADAFRASRLEGDWGRAFGTLPPGVVTDSAIAACG